MNETTQPRDYADEHFGGEQHGPAAKPAPKRRGPKPGWKKQQAPGQRPVREPTRPTPPDDDRTTYPAPPMVVPASPPASPAPVILPPDPDRTAERVVAWMEERLSRLDFLAFGNKPRILVFAVEDVSPSEIDHEPDWIAGCKFIPLEIRKVLAARNLIDVIHSTGDEGFRVLSLSHGKDFEFPAGQIQYGHSTRATPWLVGIQAAVTAYTAHLAKLGIEVREKVVLMCSDFYFGDDFRPALKHFHEWAKKEGRVTLVPAVFGNVSMTTAAEFATPGAPVFPLKEVSLSQFFQIVSQSVVRISQTNPKAGAMARELADAVPANARVNPRQ